MRVNNGKNHVSLLLLLFNIVCLCVHTSDCLKNGNVDYYTSQHGLRKLADVEHEIASAISNYVTILERRLEVAKRFLNDFESSGVNFDSAAVGITRQVDNSSNIGRNDVTKLTKDKASMASSVTAHPLRSYRLLRRFVTDLPALEKEMRSDEERKFLKFTEKIKTKTPFPTQRDIQGATEGILRAHDTYNMNIEDFASGNFHGLVTNASMNAADCFFIGMYSLQSTILTRAVEWLEIAYKLIVTQNDKSIAKNVVKEKLKDAISQHNDALSKRSQNPYLFTEPLKLQESLRFSARPRRRLLDGDHHVLQNRHSSMVDLTNFAALCSGKELRSNEEVSQLKCWYENRRPLTILNPLKVERHSFQPLVLQLYDLLPERLTSKILESATETMSRSEVHAKTQPGNKMISSSRTSTSTWLRDDKSSTIKEITGVYRRLEEFTGLKILEKGASEDLQVSCYGIAGHFNPHLDTIFNSVDKSDLATEEVYKGDRFATIMFYLSDVLRGGATAFSRIGVTARPIKGSAIFWYNMNDQAEPEQLSLHGGCPILYGNKCVSNKWIRFNAQLPQCFPTSTHLSSTSTNK